MATVATKKKTTKKLSPAAMAAKVKAEIEKRNKIFKAATAAEKRVLIAKDVLAQVAAGRFKPTEGSWANPRTASGREIHIWDTDKYDPDASVREMFLGEQIAKCDCCALGAMFVSCTLYNNKTTLEDFDNETLDFVDNVQDASFSNGFAKFFSPAQLRLIEIAFEGGCGGFCTTSDDDQDLQARDWYDRYPNPKKRLVALMKNIIKNDGKFVP
ncbi:hypothetical protein EBZ39_00405 [bacterium]|nr:hypothetical protein [bacterium]